MKAIIIKDDGLAYVADLPEEPNIEFDNSMWLYQKALAIAKKSAIICENQEQAKELLFKPGLKVIIDKDFSNGWEVTLLEWAKLYAKVKDDGEPRQTMKYRLTIKPGIYPIPDLQWEKEYQWRPHDTDKWRATNVDYWNEPNHRHKRIVAILSKIKP